MRLRRLAQILAVLMIALEALCVMAWTFVLVGGLSSPLWRWLSKAGAEIGRAVAWFCAGGLGWKLARVQIERERRADSMARLLIDVAGWRRERAERTARGLAQYVASPQRGGLPGEVWRPGHGWESRRTLLARQWDRQQAAWLCPACHHGNHGCAPGRCRCPGRLAL